MMRYSITALSLISAVLALPESYSKSETTANAVGVYDFVIVGGGTAGLVVANRLTEDPYTSVAVVEAGDIEWNNTNVTSVTGYGKAFGTPIDWQYESEPQKYALNETQVMRAGKALGGTSNINGFVYLRAQQDQIDSWELIGNKGWNWKSLMQYYKRSEQFQAPTEDDAERYGLAYDASVHGFHGPLKVGWNKGLLGRSVTSLVNATYTALGIPYREDINAGSMRGFTRYATTVDSEANERETSARAYYQPYQNRTNLKVFTNSFVHRITWDESSNGTEPRADGVVYTDASGKQQTIAARKEVILSAGSLRSPLLLELSGVGNPDILSKYNIDVKVANKFVGENLQDQTTGQGAYGSNKSYSGTADYVGFFSASDVFGNETSALNKTVLSSLGTYAQTVVDASNGVLDFNTTLSLFKIHYDLIFKKDTPVTEMLITPGDGSVSFSFWGLLPFSRGNIHIQSANATAAAAINPNYFMLGYDVEQQIGTAKIARALSETAALGSIITNETTPGYARLAKDAGHDEWAAWVKESYRSNFHYIATAAMMAKELGGVVDGDLLVYGTQNVRVIDASVIPFQVCGHLSSTIYAVAEKAAHAIKCKYE